MITLSFLFELANREKWECHFAALMQLPGVGWRAEDSLSRDTTMSGWVSQGSRLSPHETADRS
ncbi:hypothetical protein, partial [Bradyrhizobium sp.]|uniref:hypothetical protein n=1 Tax=Bradyrhizobium sp. TaxID=376 RepID=UPI0023A00FA5